MALLVLQLPFLLHRLPVLLLETYGLTIRPIHGLGFRV